MSSQPFDSIDTPAQVPAWAVFATLGVLAITWAAATLTIEANAAESERRAPTPAFQLMRG